MHCDYKCKGSIDSTTKSYVVRPAGDASRAIILLPDIFGFSAQSCYVADNLSERLNAIVVYPDTWNGKPWSLENFPPKDHHEIVNWIKAEGDYPTIQKAKILAAVEEAKALGAPADKIGAVGFCYGAKLASHAFHDGIFASIAVAHPSFYGADEFAGALKGPVCILVSKDESGANMDAIEDSISKDATFGGKCRTSSTSLSFHSPTPSLFSPSLTPSSR